MSSHHLTVDQISIFVLDYGGCIPRRGFHRLASSLMMQSIRFVREDTSTRGGCRKASFQYSAFTHIFVYIVMMLIYVDLGHDV